MSKRKNLIKGLLFPHLAIAVISLPIAACALIYVMMRMEPDAPVSIAAYTFSSYVLVIWCVRVPSIISAFKRFRATNRHVLHWTQDVRLRTTMTLCGSALWNGIYAIFQLSLGIHHASFWFYSIAIYYGTLALMRLFLVHYTVKHTLGQNRRRELRLYRFCGRIFLVTNLALALMIFFMVYWNRTFHHHEITTIAMATYTFTSLTIAIINAGKYRMPDDPILSASKSISLAAACVSILTLEATMLTTFGAGTTVLTRRLFLGISGAVVSILILSMAIHMIVQARKALHHEKA